MNKDTLEKLHYYELKEIVKNYCVSGLGKRLIDKLEPGDNIKVVCQRLKETSEGRRLLDASYNVPIDGIHNILPMVEALEKGAVLEAESLTVVSDFLRGCRKVKLFMKDKEGYAPTLSAYGENITDLSYIEEEINLSIRGNRVDSNASKELRKIRRQIDICEGKLKERLEKFLKSPENKEYIQEFFISQRNGKYTIPIKAAHKNRVVGNIVETSSKGTTVFIEPAAVSKYTSELAMLQAEEAVEEYRILSQISHMIYERIRDLKINVEVISEYDMILAKAKYSKAVMGISPKLNDRGYIKIIKGSYPLIESSVPLDFEIGEDYRGLIITGPNAGGKTVVLKTVGLLTLAVQSGFHIAAEEGTEMSVFKRLFVDIGDNQSIENALSTFSAHIKNISEIVKESSKSTLLLLDEIGSGTEPNEGSAIAIAILEELYQRGSITVATTHYGEIKNFALEHPDYESAAMEFQKDTLEPLYRLTIGKVGESNALYIAKKMGLSAPILEKAKRYMQSKAYDYSLVRESKVIKDKEVKHTEVSYEYAIGDKVLLLDKNQSAIVYKEKDKYNNITVLYNKEFIEVNSKRVSLQIKAEDFYPEGYDMNQLFISFKERKLERDIERGSKKALKEIRKSW